MRDEDLFYLSLNLRTVGAYVIILSFPIDYFRKLRSLMQYGPFPAARDGIFLISAFAR